MTVACVAEELQSQQGPYGARGRDHLRSGESALSEDLVQVTRDQAGEEQEEAAELGAEVAGRQVEPADVGRIGDDRTRLVGSLVVAAPGQFGEALFLQDCSDGRRAQRFAVAVEGAADVVDGEVLLAQGDHLIPQSRLLAGRSALASAREEEVALGLIAELMDEDPEAPRRVPEAGGGFRRRDAIDEEGAESLILSVGGAGGLQEQAGES